MLRLNSLIAVKKKRKRVGRGGDRGGFSGRGHDGQKARPGAASEIKAYFEGGQMPLSRRLPRRGFTNVFKKEYCLVNLEILDKKFNGGDTIDLEKLREKRVIKGHNTPLVKVLGDGTLSKKLIIHAHAFSKKALDAIEKAGGKAVLIKETGSGSITA
jgi:large subunit ribosomal protein L15